MYIHLKYTQLFVCQLYLNKALKNKKEYIWSKNYLHFTSLHAYYSLKNVREVQFVPLFIDLLLNYCHLFLLLLLVLRASCISNDSALVCTLTSSNF